MSIFEPSRLRALLKAALARLEWLSGRVPPRLRRGIGLGLNLALLALVGLIIYQHQELLPTLREALSPQILVACLGLYLLSLLFQTVIWIDLMGYQLSEYPVAVEDYVQTNLMSRLPGGIWKLIGRMTIYRTPRLSAGAVLVINLFELLLLILSAGLIVSLLLPLAPGWRALIVGGILVALGLSVRRLGGLVPGLQRPLPLLRPLIWLAGYLLCWLGGAALAYLIFLPFASLSFLDLLLPVTLSGMVSLALQFLPISLLFRDLTLVTLMAPFMSPSQAIVAIFALRLVSSVCELLASWLLISGVQLLPRRTPPLAVPQDQPAPHHPPG
jgi:hypothetical protein